MWQRLKGKLIVAVVLTVGIFFVLSLLADVHKVRTSLLSFRWGLLPLILGLACINYLLRFFKWHYYVRTLSITMSAKESLTIFFSGLAMSVTPAKFGEVLKSFLVKQRYGVPMSRTAPIIFAERFTDFVALVILSLIGILGFQYGRSVTFIGLILSILLIVFIFQQKIWIKFISIAERIPKVSPWAAKLDMAYESTLHLLRAKRLVVASGLSLPAWLAEGLGCYVVFEGMNVSISILKAVFIYSFSTLVGAITMLPGGLGGTEGSLTALAVLHGASKPFAVSSTFLIRLCTLWFAVLLGMGVLLWHRKKWETVAVSISTMDK